MYILYIIYVVLLSTGNVGISCDGQNAVDKQNILKVDFEPKGGLDLVGF